MHHSTIDGVAFTLKAPFDFSFLRKYGKVFRVFDDQDSGNICFGLDDGQRKYFAKFAGAPTQRTCVSAAEAIANLKRTVPVYQELAHPNLITFIQAEEITDGLLMLFDWVDAECPHPMYPQSRERFLQLATPAIKQQMFADILRFHAHVAAKGYVAIDFYDGSMMYDFNNARTVLCDIDFYAKQPYVNQMGRLWGSSRFMAPEEFQLGAAIDELTNVYTMGATAFSLFSSERGSRDITHWQLSETLYDIAKRAISDERSARQQSIAQLAQEWGAA